MAATSGGLGESISLDTPLEDVQTAANAAGMVACAYMDDVATAPVDHCN